MFQYRILANYFLKKSLFPNQNFKISMVSCNQIRSYRAMTRTKYIFHNFEENAVSSSLIKNKLLQVTTEARARAEVFEISHSKTTKALDNLKPPIHPKTQILLENQQLEPYSKNLYHNICSTLLKIELFKVNVLLSYKNQSIDINSVSVYWFLYDGNIWIAKQTNKYSK